MKRTEHIMGMPITIEVVGANNVNSAVDAIFAYFREIDSRYSTYKKTSEISQINAGLAKSKWSDEVRRILRMCEQTKQDTDGFFDIERGDQIDPSGLVKGWAIDQAAKQLQANGLTDFCLEAGGDFQVNGFNTHGEPWKIGIRNPFNRHEIVKVLALRSEGVATSGTAIRDQHIYNPHAPDKPITDIVSLTVIGPNAYEADRFATAAFAMGRGGITFIESRLDLEGYMVDKDGVATLTSGFGKYAFSSEDTRVTIS